VKRKGKLTSVTPKKAGYEVGQCILGLPNKTQNVLISIDETESLNEDLVKQLLNEFVLAIQGVLSENGYSFRLILAGRYIYKWKQLDISIPLEPISLSPFDFHAVYQTVERFASRNNFRLLTNHKEEFASHLMYFTGGHPRCMATILSEDLGIPIKEIVSNEAAYYTSIVSPVIDEIKTHLPHELKGIFETLSVVRRFNARLLKWFIEKKLLEWPKDTEYELENLLLQTYLVSKKSGFLKDDIIRRLLAIHLRKTNMERFIKICEESIAFYTARLKDLQAFRPDIIVVELLFQKVQYFFHQDPEHVKEQIFKAVDDILTLLVPDRDFQAVLDGLVECLRGDWEFRFMFNYLLSSRIYSEKPFHDLIKKIECF
jgi:hypothetical protein